MRGKASSYEFTKAFLTTQSMSQYGGHHIHETDFCNASLEQPRPIASHRPPTASHLHNDRSRCTEQSSLEIRVLARERHKQPYNPQFALEMGAWIKPERAILQRALTRRHRGLPKTSRYCSSEDVLQAWSLCHAFAAFPDCIDHRSKLSNGKLHDTPMLIVSSARRYRRRICSNADAKLKVP